MKTITINGDEFDCPFADELPPLLPSLSEEERTGLEADIRKNGVLQPVIYARHNGKFVLIDGHNRAEIAAELGKRIPVCEQHYTSFEAMKTHALELNLHRRHLDPEQKRQLIAGALKSNPEQSNNAIAKALKVSDKTVDAVRDELELTSEIPKLSVRRGQDGKERKKPTRKTKPNPSPAPEPPGIPDEQDTTTVEAADTVSPAADPPAAKGAGITTMKRWGSTLTTLHIELFFVAGWRSNYPRCG
jgi:ParB/RepB/Spo0J family partition protein